MALLRSSSDRQPSTQTYMPEQNGVFEHFFRSLREERVWPHNFASFAAARRHLADWIRWYNQGRPHRALGYRSPRQFRALQQPVRVA